MCAQDVAQHNASIVNHKQQDDLSHSISNANVWTHPRRTELIIHFVWLFSRRRISHLVTCAISLLMMTFFRLHFADFMKTKRTHSSSTYSSNLLLYFLLYSVETEFIEIKCTYHWIHRCVNSFFITSCLCATRHMIVGYIPYILYENHRIDRILFFFRIVASELIRRRREKKGKERKR